MTVNKQAYNFSKAMNEKIQRILDRYELDKPIMMQDKLDMIWDKPKGKHSQSLISETSPRAHRTPGSNTCGTGFEFNPPMTAETGQSYTERLWTGDGY
jgi:hypothetical protein